MSFRVYNNAITISILSISILISAQSSNAGFVIGGAPPESHENSRLASVVMLVIPHKSAAGTEIEICTGTFITPSAIITAAHCFNKWDQQSDIFYSDRDTHSVDEIRTLVRGESDGFKKVTQKPFIHPRFKSGEARDEALDGDPRADLALLQTGEIAHSVMKVDRQSARLVEQSVSVVGYGVSEIHCVTFMIDPFMCGVGTKRIGKTNLSSSDESLLRIQALDVFSEENGQPLTVSAFMGDSGGPLVQLIDGMYTLIGVVSKGTLDRYGNLTSIFVDLASAWTVEFITAANEKGFDVNP